MDDKSMKLRNQTEEEVQAEITRRSQSQDIEILNELDADPKTDPRSVHRTYEVLFMNFAGRPLDENAESKIQAQADNEFRGVYCRDLANATLATCLDTPTNEHIEGLERVAKNRRDKHLKKVEDLAETYLKKRNDA